MTQCRRREERKRREDCETVKCASRRRLGRAERVCWERERILGRQCDEGGGEAGIMI